MPITHAFTNPKADGADATVVRPSNWNANHTITADSSFPGYEFDYVAFTSPVTVSGANEGAATTVVTGSAVTYDGSTIVVVHFFAPYVTVGSVANSEVDIWLYQDGSSIGAMGTIINPVATNSLNVPVQLETRFTPAAGSHTYSIRASRSSAGSVGAGAGGSGAYRPGFIRITKV